MASQPQHKFVRIDHRHGYCAGEVVSAHNYGTEAESDWYIEFRCHNCGGGYLKQIIDAPQHGPFKITFSDADEFPRDWIPNLCPPC